MDQIQQVNQSNLSKEDKKLYNENIQLKNELKKLANKNTELELEIIKLKHFIGGDK